jgi:hypothetical protein
MTVSSVDKDGTTSSSMNIHLSLINTAVARKDEHWTPQEQVFESLHLGWFVRPAGTWWWSNITRHNKSDFVV